MDGWVRAGFEDVARVFRRQLRRTTGGAAVAVYHRGELAVDLWGGWRAEVRPWQRDTLAMCFSTTKGVISTALHLLILVARFGSLDTCSVEASHPCTT